MKKFLIITLLSSAAVFILYFFQKYNFESRAKVCLEITYKWKSQTNLANTNQYDVLKLENELHNNKFKLIELKVLNQKTSEIIFLKNSGRFKLTNWVPIKKSIYDFNYDECNFFGIEGEFTVLEFYSVYPESDIVIRGLIRFLK